MTTFATIPDYFIGVNLENATITPCTKDPLTGGLTKATPVSDLATSYVVDHIVIDQSVVQSMIKSANARMANYVNLYDDFELEIGEIKGGGGSGLVLNIWVGFDFGLAEVVVSPDGGTTNFTVQVPFTRAGLNDPYAEDKSVMVYKGKPCGLPVAYVQDGDTLPYG